MSIKTDREETRRRDLAKIHVAKKQLGLSDDDYRDILDRIGSVRSAAELSGIARLAVLTEFKRLGWAPDQPRRRRHRAPGPVDESLHAMIQKIAALLGDRTWAYADGIVRKMFGVDSVRFCNHEQLHKVIAALSYDQQRRQKRANPQSTLSEDYMDEATWLQAGRPFHKITLPEEREGS